MDGFLWAGFKGIGRGRENDPPIHSYCLLTGCRDKTRMHVATFRLLLLCFLLFVHLLHDTPLLADIPGVESHTWEMGWREQARERVYPGLARLGGFLRWGGKDGKKGGDTGVG